MIKIWLDCLIPRPVRSCVVLTEIIKQKRILPLFVFGALLEIVLSMFFFGMERTLFCTWEDFNGAIVLMIVCIIHYRKDYTMQLTAIDLPNQLFRRNSR